MTCKACGYNKEQAERNAAEAEGALSARLVKTLRAYCKPWIELRGVERMPFTITCDPNNEPLEVGRPAFLYACPQCGTVRMEVEG